MKLESNRKYMTIAIYTFLVLVGALLFWAMLNRLEVFMAIGGQIATLLRPFVYAFGMAYILNPVVMFIEKNLLAHIIKADKPKRAVSILLAYIVAVSLITIFMMIVLPQLINSVASLIGNMQDLVNSFNTDKWFVYLSTLLPDLDWGDTIFNYLKDYASTIVRTISSTLTYKVWPMLSNLTVGVASGLLNIVVGVIVSIYMLADKERFSAGIKRIWYALLPREKADWVLELAGDANRIFGGFISGKILDSLIIGVLCFLGMSLLNIPNAMLVSVVVGVTNVIPYFGPFIGAIPSFFIILIESPIKSLVFLLFVLILQQLDGNVIGPKILGDSTGLSAFWVIFAITLFGGLYGFIGMFLGVPVFSVVFMLLGRFIHTRLVRQGMPLDMEDYCAPDAPLLRSSKKEAPARKQHTKAHTVKPLSKREDDGD